MVDQVVDAVTVDPLCRDLQHPRGDLEPGAPEVGVCLARYLAPAVQMGCRGGELRRASNSGSIRPAPGFAFGDVGFTIALENVGWGRPMGLNPGGTAVAIAPLPHGHYVGLEYELR